MDRLAEQHANFTEHMTALGFPTSHISTSVAPYDLIADYFRGATGTMKDLYRKKDKLLQLLDKACTFLTRQTINWSKASGHPIVFFPIHWGPDNFMSQSSSRPFWWPTFRKLMMNLDRGRHHPDAAVGSALHQRLEVIRDIPPGRCIYWFERTDMVRAFEVLGDVVALRGNISPSLLTTGKPQQVTPPCGTWPTNVSTRAASSFSTPLSVFRTRTPSRKRAPCTRQHKYAS